LVVKFGRAYNNNIAFQPLGSLHVQTPRELGAMQNFLNENAQGVHGPNLGSGK